MSRRLTDLIREGYDGPVCTVGSPERMGWFRKEKKRIHIFALGDVGGTLLTGLRLLGNDCLSAIGIYDVRETYAARWEMEMNQVALPWEYDHFPPVEIVTADTLYDCDIFVFCASRGVPPVTEKTKDVRMAQYEANATLVKETASRVVNAGFQGLFAVVSDPVDLLCRAAASAGLAPEQVKGYGLGVMNARGIYYARRDPRFSSFLTEGAAFGPHGQDLVLANSLSPSRYDDALSRELTELAVTANLSMRELGFKPYMAPALSSGALSLLATASGRWHYSSSCFGGVWLGAKNRVTASGIEVENPELPEALYARIQSAWEELNRIPPV